MATKTSYNYPLSDFPHRLRSLSEVPCPATFSDYYCLTAEIAVGYDRNSTVRGISVAKRHWLCAGGSS
jgi:hypothetical protein